MQNSFHQTKCSKGSSVFSGTEGHIWICGIKKKWES